MIAETGRRQISTRRKRAAALAAGLALGLVTAGLRAPVLADSIQSGPVTTVAPSPGDMSVSTQLLDFGAVTAGTTATQDMTITMTAPPSVTTGNYEVTLAEPQLHQIPNTAAASIYDFVVSGTPDCFVDPIEAAAGTTLTCAFSVEFTPTSWDTEEVASFPLEAVLNGTDYPVRDAGGVPITVYLTGRAAADNSTHTDPESRGAMLVTEGNDATVNWGHIGEYDSDNNSQPNEGFSYDAVQWGDGTSTNDTIEPGWDGTCCTYEGRTLSGDHTYVDPGVYIATASGTRPTNVDTSSTANYTYSVAVIVVEGDLTAGVCYNTNYGCTSDTDGPVGPRPISPPEQQSWTGTVAAFGDADLAATPAAFETNGAANVTIDWGDGTSLDSSSGTISDAGINNSGSWDPVINVESPNTNDFTVSGTHTYAEGGTYDGTVTLTDNDGAVQTDSFVATVPDDPMQLNLPGSFNYSGVNNSTVSGPDGTDIASFTDTDPTSQAAANYTASVDWGDGHTDTVTPVADGSTPNTFDIPAAHTYSSAGCACTYINITVSDKAGGQAKGQITPLVTAGASATQFTSSAEEDIVQGQDYAGAGEQNGDFVVSTTGSPTAVLTETGALPSGMYFNDNHDGTASISGAPPLDGTIQHTVETDITITAQATASDGTLVGNPVTQQLKIMVEPSVSPLQITSGNLPDATNGQPYSYQMQLSGGSNLPKAWSLAADQTTNCAEAPLCGLPSGLSMDVGGYISGMVEGSSGDYTVNVTVSDLDPSVAPTTQLVYLHVAPAPNAMTIDTPSLPGAEEGQSFGPMALLASGGLPDNNGNYTWSVLNGSLPSGLSLDPDGTISGTPASGSAGTYFVTVGAGDTALPQNTATRELALVVTPAGTTPPGLTDAATMAPGAGSVTVGGQGSDAPDDTATGSGTSGALTIGVFPSNPLPVSPSVEGAPETFVVATESGSSLDSVVVSGCLTDGAALYWWDPGSSAWQTLGSASAQGACPTASITSSSQPALSDLGPYAIFAVGVPASGNGGGTQPVTLPAPGNVQATNANGTVNVTWSAPSGSGADAITGYLVTTANGATPITQPVPGTQVGPDGTYNASFSGLDPASVYPVTVQSTDGGGDLSAPATAVALPPSQDSAPPPAGAPAGALDLIGGTTYNSQQDDNMTASAADGVTVSVDVPSGSLHDGTVVSVYSVDLSKIATSPQTAGYVAGIAVSWQAPDGTHPDVSGGKHVTMTINSNAIHANDPIFQLNPDGSVTYLGTALVDGSATVTFTSDPTFLVGTPAPAVSGGATGGGGAPSSPPASSASGTPEPAGGTYASSSAPPSASNPTVVKVTTPVAGSVSVTPATGAPAAPSGYELFGQSELITAPAATTAQPLVLSFEVDRSALPAGADGSELTVTRDGVPAPSCPGATTIGASDPCVTSVVDHGSYVTITVLSTHASTWSEVAATTDRVAGVDRIGTAVATSQAYFGAGQAKAAVLARDDSYADALAGDPLAAAKGGPLLLSAPGALPASVATELTRALAPGSTVYLLGGDAALSPAVEQAVGALGFKVVRLGGADRYATAVAVAGAIGNPSAVLLASGLDFPDALAAGAAAAHTGAVVLLTAGPAQASATAAYLGQHPGTAVYAIGGPAASADPAATALVGADRYATAVAVAKRFFPQAGAAGLASGLGYADALSAGAVLGANGEPLLLTDPHALSPATASYIQGGITQLHTFGGPAAVAFNPTPALTVPAALFRLLGTAL